MRRLSLIFFAYALFAQSGLPTNAPNRTVFYQEVRAVRDSIIANETKYYAKNKRYFQGLPSDTTTRSIAPALKQFNRLTKPSDQKETWIDFGLRDISVRGTYRVDVYDGPLGKGYVMGVRIKVDTSYYELRKNVGPETWNDTGLTFIIQTLKATKGNL